MNQSIPIEFDSFVTKRQGQNMECPENKNNGYEQLCTRKIRTYFEDQPTAFELANDAAFGGVGKGDGGMIEMSTSRKGTEHRRHCNHSRGHELGNGVLGRWLALQIHANRSKSTGSCHDGCGRKARSELDQEQSIGQMANVTHGNVVMKELDRGRVAVSR